MKQGLIVLLAAFIFSCGNSKKATVTFTQLNGNWIPISQEMGGKALPAAFYEKQQLNINDSNYTLIAESVDEGVVRYNGDKMDIFGRDGVNKGKHFTGLFKLENGQLTICYNLRGDSYPESFDSNGKPLFFVSVFKKAN